MKKHAPGIRISVLCTSLLLSACAFDHPVGPEDAFQPMQRYPIAVEAQMANFRLALDTARGDLDARSEPDLQQIAADYLENGSGSISVAVAGNNRNAAGRVADRLTALGVPRNQITIAGDNAPPPAGEARVSFVRYHADPPVCGNWSENLGITYRNDPSPNFGCATQHNLAVMVADPHDLVAPKNLQAGDAQRTLTVLDKYRKGDTTVATKAEEQSGTVAAVAGSK